MPDGTPIQAMLVSVGGAVAPAIHTLNEQQPRFICFFVSPDSQPSIRDKILPALRYTPEHYDWIVTETPQSLLECYRVLAQQLSPILAKWGVPREALGVEFTAGTKPMSVAVVLATIETSSAFFYVGARDPSGRDREGIGVVLDGKESTWFQTNPWEELAVTARKEIALLFNHGRFTDAQERTLRLAKVAPVEMRKVYESLAELIEGYALWDRFEYKQAQAKISKAFNALRLYIAGRNDPLHSTLNQVEPQIGFLRAHEERTSEALRLDTLDMLANASRRADMAQKYDDAVARLYSVLEALARNRLLDGYQIKAGGVKPEQVPEGLRAEYVRLFSDPEKPETGLRLGLQAQYHLLHALGDKLGERFAAQEKSLERVLLARNQSRLAHGTEPVKPEIYQKLREIILDFAEINENEIPKFPEMKL